MSEYRKQFRGLGNLLGGFFHQDWKEVIDWREEVPTYQGIVVFYKTIATPLELQTTREQLRNFLAMPFDEAALEEVVRKDFHTSYYPPSDGQTYRQWLTDVLRLLEEPAAPSNLRFTR